MEIKTISSKNLEIIKNNEIVKAFIAMPKEQKNTTLLHI